MEKPPRFDVAVFFLLPLFTLSEILACQTGFIHDVGRPRSPSPSGEGPTAAEPGASRALPVEHPARGRPPSPREHGDALPQESFDLEQVPDLSRVAK